MTNQSHRGILAAFAAANPASPQEVLSELTTTFAEFRRRTDASVRSALEGVDDLAQRVSGLQIGGAGSAPREPNMSQMSEALRSYIKTGDETAMAALVGTPQTGMSGQVDPDGGYFTDEDLSGHMNRKIFQISPMRKLARVVNVSGDELEEINDIDEAAAAWVSEISDRPDTLNPKIGKLTVPVWEMYACPKITQRLLDDAMIDLATWITNKCVQQFARKEGAAFVNGSGSGQPHGLLQYPTSATSDATRPWGTIQYLTTGIADALSDSTHNGGDVLIELSYSIKPAYRGNAAWLMNRATAAKIRQLKDGNGRYLWENSLQPGQPPMLLGFPVHLDEEMPDIAADAFPIAFGDFSAAYVVVDRKGLRLLRDPYTSKPFTRFYCYKRVGGGLANSEAVKLLKIAV